MAPFTLRGRRAIVTGAAQGIGLALSRRLLLSGASVCLSDVDVRRGEEAAERLDTELLPDENEAAETPRVCFVRCDVTSAEDWRYMWNKAEESLGGAIDILCNNAGVPWMAGIDACMNVMGLGATHGAFYALERMRISNGGNGGRIVTTASYAGFMSIGVGKDVHAAGYHIPKWGNVAMTKVFGTAAQPAPDIDGVKAYAVAPSFATTALGNATVGEREPLFRRQGFRMLRVEDEIVDCFLAAFERDSNGSVYIVTPGSAYVEAPNIENRIYFIVARLIGVIARLMGIRVLPAWGVMVALIVLWPILPLLFVIAYIAESVGLYYFRKYS